MGKLKAIAIIMKNFFTNRREKIKHFLAQLASFKNGLNEENMSCLNIDFVL